jgi:hypothetical protein
MKTTLYSFAGPAIAIAIVASAVAGPLPERIESELAENALAIRQLTVEYQVVCSSPLPREEVLRRINQPKWSDYGLPDAYRLTLQDGKFAIRTSLQVGSRDGTVVSENLRTFDGTLEYGSDLRESGAAIGISDARYHEQHSPLHAAIGYNYFLADAGFSVPEESVTSLRPLESTVLYLLRIGATLVRHSGDAAADDGDYEVVLSKAGIEHRYLLDLSKTCAVRVHEERSAQGNLRYATENSNFQKLAGTGCWLPRLCRMRCYTWPSIEPATRSDVLVLEDVIVSEISNEPLPDSEFVIDYKKPGNLVGDSRLPGGADSPTGAVSYRVPANLDYLDEVVAAAVEGKEFIVPNESNRLKWLVLANVTAIAVLIALVAKKYHGASVA